MNFRDIAISQVLTLWVDQHLARTDKFQSHSFIPQTYGSEVYDVMNNIYYIILL